MTHESFETFQTIWQFWNHEGKSIRNELLDRIFPLVIFLDRPFPPFQIIGISRINNIRIRLPVTRWSRGMTPSTLRSKDPTGVRPYRVSAYLPYIWLAPEYPRCLIEKHATSIEKKKEKKTAHPAWSIVRARQVTWKLGVEFRKCCTGGPRLVPCPGKNCWRTKCSKNTTVFVRNDKLRIVV